MPIHLTLDPAPDRLEPYPTPFRHTLTAVAPQPGAPVGALTSEALAVGDDGEVARYTVDRNQEGKKKVPEGWQPEPLLGASGLHTPRLRAVAWPTPSRAYAVGVLGEMWLWRAETGLWEKDPATPLNFRGNLLGIAFESHHPAGAHEPGRGYAVGQQGVLLRYGKTWTQEPEANLPPEAQGASFTSIAFAGSEAIVAFRVVHQVAGETPHYTGGVLVNNGSGWQVDQAADEALGGTVPWAVAALPDGGAAVSATAGGLPGTATIIERNSAGSAWQAAPPYPGTEAPGSLALFREGGALRAIGSGGMPNTGQVEELPPPPAGFPPNLIAPYPLVEWLCAPPDRQRMERRGTRAQPGRGSARRIQVLRPGLPARPQRGRPDQRKRHRRMGCRRVREHPPAAAQHRRRRPLPRRSGQHPARGQGRAGPTDRNAGRAQCHGRDLRDRRGCGV